MDQATVNSLSIVLVAIISGYFGIRTITAQARLKRAEDLAKEKIEAARLEAEHRIEAAKLESSQEVEFRRDLLNLQERLQQTVERQQKDLEAKDEKMERAREGWHARANEMQVVLNAAHERENEAHKRELDLTARVGQLEKKYAVEMAAMEARQHDEATRCEAEIQELRSKICAGELEIRRLRSELEHFRTPPAESVPGESDPPIGPVVPREGC